MVDALDLWEKPDSQNIYMLVGWRQWADAGSVSSGLPHYLVQQTKAQPIGTIRPDGFYVFQVPGTHDLFRPVVKFVDGYPEALQVQRNELFYTQDEQRGLVIFLGDEPQLDVERYVTALLDCARALGVKRMIGLGGVYGELPYDKERMVSCIYSMPKLKKEIDNLAVNLSDYQGGASIESYICKRAAEQNLEYISFYAFVPTYDFSQIDQIKNSIRIENDYVAWLGVMRRINHMLKLGIDLSDLEEKSTRLIEVVQAKVEELDNLTPEHTVRDYMQRLSDEYKEILFNPQDDFWEEKLQRLFDKHDDGQTE